MIKFKQLSYWEKVTFLEGIDLLVVGSGIVGLSTAIHYKIRFPKKKVVILERGYLPSGASTKNAGFACFGSASELLADLEQNPSDVVWETVDKRWRGLAYLKELIGEKQMNFQAKGSYELFMPSEKKSYQKCLDQLPFLNKQMKMITALKETYTRDQGIIGNCAFAGFNYAISNSVEGMLDTGAMMLALIKKATDLNVIILNGIQCEVVESGQVQTNYGKIRSKQIAICTNGLGAQLMKLDVKPARAQVVVTSELDQLPFDSCFHFDKGYYYFRSVGNRVLFGGGRNQNFEAEETDELNTSDQIINHLAYLLESRILPGKPFTIDHQWAGTMGVGLTKAPIMEEVSPGVFCAVRLGGMGVAIGSLVGKELAQNLAI